MRSSRFVTLESDAGKKWFPKKTFSGMEQRHISNPVKQYGLLSVNYFRKKTSPHMLDRVLDTSL